MGGQLGRERGRLGGPPAPPQCGFLFPPEPGTGYVWERLCLALTGSLVAIVTENLLMVYDEQITLPGV